MSGKVGEVFLLLQPNTHPENGCEDCFSSLLVTSSLEESLAGTQGYLTYVRKFSTVVAF